MTVLQRYCDSVTVTVLQCYCDGVTVTVLPGTVQCLSLCSRQLYFSLSGTLTDSSSSGKAPAKVSATWGEEGGVRGTTR